jgi:glycosyltransferase involved in cell wall biosynthesis
MFTIGALGHAVAKKSGVPLVASIHTQWDKLFRHYPTTVIAAAFGIGIGYPLYFGLRNTMSTYLQTGSERNPLSQQFGRNLLLFANECDAVIAPSLHVMDKLKRFHCKTPLYHIPNGIERIDIKMTVQLPSNSRQAVKFVCVGRVSKEKRTAKLIEAFIGLKQIDAELFIIGDGPDLSTCVELVENRNASNRVHFLGSLPNDQTRQLIADSDILVLASHGFDNQPMVILEALMAGKGVLYCDEQLRDGLDRSNSLLVPHSIAGLREGLRILSSNPELVAKLAKGSQKLAKEYDYIRIAKRVEEVYKKLLS